MILTKELLKQYDACKQGITFCERNKLFGFDLERIAEVRGDYNGFVKWLIQDIISGTVVMDENNNIISMLHEDGYRINLEYDSHGNKIKRESINPNTPDIFYWLKYEYDKNGNRIKSENSDGIIWQYEYDDKNNKIADTASDGYWWRYEYNDNGNLTREENSDGYWIIYSYDANGNRIESENCYDDVFYYKYDSNGNRIKEEHKYGYIKDSYIEYYPNGQLKQYDDLYIPLI